MKTDIKRSDIKQSDKAYDRYGDPLSGPHGESTEKNIKFWSKRATKNSEVAPRAKDK